ncbi:hypothetical protein ABZ234_01345 [Nocardiopsis sp. NPDC006198]|uniref:hypothetical protein n=1 Tax=Nocardiopsis sp. NPDC006198 TaxID=3154472 RepID=UPI0033AC2918
MRSVVFSMRRAGVFSVGLSDVLRRVPENNWKWVLLEFDGAGDMPRGMTFWQLEEELMDREGGVSLGWEEVKNFSEGLHQEIEMRMVAVDWDVRVQFETFLDLDFYVAVEARDSSEWEVWESLVEGLVGSLSDAYLS